MLRYESRPPGPRYSEVAILQALKAATDPRARQRLQEELIRVGRWTKRIKALARRWACEAIEPEEFEQAGLMGLLEAAGRFDGGDGEGWPTFATQWAVRRMQELARKQAGPVVLETQWEQRTARRQRVARRPAGWLTVELPKDARAGQGYAGDGTAPSDMRYRAVCAAMKDMQAAGDDQAAREAQRQALPVALARLPPWARSSLASITGERAGPLPALAEIREMLRKAALRRLRRELEGV